MNTSYSELLDRAWKTMRPQLPMTIALTIVIAIGMGLFSRVPYASLLTNIILSPGYIACLYRIKNNQSFGFSDVLWSLQSFKRFLNVVFMVIATSFLTILGFVLLIIPGIWVMVVLTFTSFIIVKDDKEAMDVLAASRDLVRGRWWYVAGLWSVLVILNILGFIALGVGVLVTAPLTVLMMMHALDDLEGKNAPATPGQGPSTASTFAVNS